MKQAKLINLSVFLKSFPDGCKSFFIEMHHGSTLREERTRRYFKPAQQKSLALLCFACRRQKLAVSCLNITEISDG